MVRWVHKRKWEKPKSDGKADSGTTGSNDKDNGYWTIRSRLTVRGFKDQQKEDIARYAGTSTRSSQRILVSEAVRNRWPMGTLDISVAFLKGVTYKELADMTGEPVREVDFYLPASCIPLLRLVPGFEDFDPQTEVLHCDKPGTGLADAPRAFSIKLKTVTDNECMMKASLIDAEMCVKHRQTNQQLQELVAMLTKHVDDIRLTGESGEVKAIIDHLHSAFGELKIE